MKNIIATILVLALQSCGSTPTVVDMADERKAEYRKNGSYYIKDKKNFMNSFIGTWQYINDRTEFRITLSKKEKYHYTAPFNVNYYKDGMVIQYQKYENGELIYNSPVGTNPNGVIEEFGKLYMSFVDYEKRNTYLLDLILIKEPNKNDKLKFTLSSIILRNDPKPKRLEYWLSLGEINPGESFFSVPDNIIMTKM
ncbi:hypothetical protein M0G43_09210 [Subsaxibacter sp. CAU 1640]|uniref:DUF6705 family protein n=1 Tax=Subsaxibacter sp. CAU 1640 TaxID=2933271 RepID=UPI00200319BF|nr:DUF6705 family protein [Subsaxibacter sp. CAU 1640]MCK7590751.1 hypothetical protein [Subsaxibacter sp. CAU 1640]